MESSHYYVLPTDSCSFAQIPVIKQHWRSLISATQFCSKFLWRCDSQTRISCERFAFAPLRLFLFGLFLVKVTCSLMSSQACCVCVGKVWSSFILKRSLCAFTAMTVARLLLSLVVIDEVPVASTAHCSQRHFLSCDVTPLRQVGDG